MDEQRLIEVRRRLERAERDGLASADTGEQLRHDAAWLLSEVERLQAKLSNAIESGVRLATSLDMRCLAIHRMAGQLGCAADEVELALGELLSRLVERADSLDCRIEEAPQAAMSEFERIGKVITAKRVPHNTMYMRELLATGELSSGRAVTVSMVLGNCSVCVEFAKEDGDDTPLGRDRFVIDIEDVIQGLAEYMAGRLGCADDEEVEFALEQALREREAYKKEVERISDLLEASSDVPTLRCPKCRAIDIDLDGFGPVACPRDVTCWCSHPAVDLDESTCGICSAEVPR